MLVRPRIFLGLKRARSENRQVVKIKRADEEKETDIAIHSNALEYNLESSLKR